jgi:hypothetical protein
MLCSGLSYSVLLIRGLSAKMAINLHDRRWKIARFYWWDRWGSKYSRGNGKVV